VATPDDHALVVVRSTKNKEAAAKFVEYLTATKSALTKYHDPAGFLPPVTNYEELAPKVFDDPGRQGTLKYAVPNVVNLPFGPNYVKVCTIAMTAIQEIITTTKPVKAILDSYQPKLEGVLQ
jgi:ABC-type glycerol-3-phosphate transport system substrate-binding protein